MDSPKTSCRSIDIIGVPSSAGARMAGQEGAPSALRAAGLVTALERLDLTVTDHGDLATVGFSPDPEHPRAQNADRVCAVAADVAAAVGKVGRRGWPLVLGGDCTITVGVVAGLLRSSSSVGLFYFDGDLDLNVPETSPSGALDGMVTAHLLGRGLAELVQLGPRHPLLSDEDIVYFAYNAHDGAIDPHELDTLTASRAAAFSLEAVMADPRTAAAEALAHLSSRVERYLVHFDVDVTDLPAVDVPHPSGLTLEAAASALEVALASPQCAGLVVTEFNAGMDPGGDQAARLVDTISRPLAP